MTKREQDDDTWGRELRFRLRGMKSKGETSLFHRRSYDCIVLSHEQSRAKGFVQRAYLEVRIWLRIMLIRLLYPRAFHELARREEALKRQFERDRKAFWHERFGPHDPGEGA